MSPSGVDLKLVELLEGSIKLNTQELSVLRNELGNQRLDIERLKGRVAMFVSVATVAINLGIAVFTHYIKP